MDDMVVNNILRLLVSVSSLEDGIFLANHKTYDTKPFLKYLRLINAVRSELCEGN